MRLQLLSLALLLSSACAIKQGPRVRVATASAAEITNAISQEDVWYEFREGDVVPFQFAFFGALEGGGEQMTPIRAKRDFFLVARKNQPLRISFDGKTFAGGRSSQYVVTVLPQQNAKGGRVGWLLYVGESGNPETELKALFEEDEQATSAAD